MTEYKLLDACRKGDVVEVQRLLPQVRDPANVRDIWKKKTLLHYSCSHGWLGVTRRLVEQYHCDPESRDWWGDTPLYVASREGHVDIVRYLVSEQGCSTACQNKWNGDTPLHVACRKGHLSIVKALTSGQDCKAACNCHNKDGDTPLHVACRKGHVDIVRYLVSEQGCSTVCKNKDGDTPLHDACYRGHVDIVRYLFSEQGCSTACQNKNGDTPLYDACYRGHVDIVRYLVSEQGCSTACQNKNGDTPLHVACRLGYLAVAEILVTGKNCSAACISKGIYGETVLHYSCHHGWLDVTRRLVEQYHCDPESEDNDGDTPLHEACREGNVDIVRYLVSEQGCSTACQNKDGDIPLHVACRKGHLSIVKALTSGQDCKAACNCQNKDGDTPLHAACRKGHVDIVRYLVSEQGCSTACQNRNGDTPLYEACRLGYLAVAEILVTGKNCSAACISKDIYGKTVLHYSCHHGWLDVTRRLVEQYHCDPESRDNGGDTPLHEACHEGNVDIVRYLGSEQGCSTACQNNNGDTPLHVACNRGHVDIVRYLVSEQGCSTACQNKNGDTPLHMACRRGRVNIVRYLVSKQGCNTACQTKDGDTPLHVACREGHVNVVKYLVSEQGCNIACQNKDGDTPVHVACGEGHLAMAKIILAGLNCSAPCLSKNNSGTTVLHYSCRHGWLDVTRRLVEQYHCDPESRDNDGDTPLHVACCEGHVNVVKYLVSEQGCNIACQNKDGDTPVHVACGEGHLAMAKIILAGLNCSAPCISKNNSGTTALHYSCRHGWLDVTRRLVEQYHCDPESRDNDGDTPLHLACRVGHVDIVRYLVSELECSVACENDNVDTSLHVACRAGHLPTAEVLLTGQNCSAACISRNTYGKTVLHYSCYHGWLDVTRRLVEQYHCGPEIRGGNGDTPLDVACRKGHVDIVRYLVGEQGCSTACQNISGDTPLHVACCEGHVDIVRYLVGEQGCTTACQNKNGDTPLHVACRQSRTPVVRFLLSTGRADPWCKNASGHAPVQLTYSYNISKLFVGLTNPDPVTAIKVFIFGNPAAGKSTLVKVIENKVTSRFGALAGQFRNVSGVELKTAGINTVTIENIRLGSVTIYDLAGQFEYYSSHDALLGNLMSSSPAIFIAVVKLSESEAEVIRTLQYWISFIENCCSRVEATAHLMVVGSWADQVKEAIDQKWANIKKACISSSSPLHFVGFTAIDCRKLASSGLDKICDMIGCSCTALKKAAERKQFIYPHLLHTFITTKLSSKVASSVEELCTLITAEDDVLLPTKPNLLSPLLSSLSDGGHLLYLPNKEDFEAGWVIINKQAVLSEINGTIFAPEYFKQHHDIATSTGVVPKSKIADVFAEKYNVDMILCVLTAFEFCQAIKDSFTLSLIASSDSSRDGAAAITTSDESSESYYFFPALVQVEHPTDVWQSSGPGQYQFGWCLQCSKEGQYLTPRFLHVLLLRLAFSFALAPDSSQQDEPSPVLRRRCAVWKNGIEWRDRNDTYIRIEVVEQNQTVLLLMCCPEKRAMACVKLRSSLVRTILNCRKELCPTVDTNEFLIDPSNLSQHQLGSTKELTTYSMADVVKAIQEGEPCALDRTGKNSLDLDIALHFEPYLGMHKRLIDQLFDKDLTHKEVDNDFLRDLAANVYPKLMQQIPIQTVLRMFNISDDSLFYSYFEQFPSERDNPVMRCFRLLLTWKNCDTGGSTYQSLRTTLDKYSIFCGRNPVSNQFKFIVNVMERSLSWILGQYFTVILTKLLCSRRVWSTIQYNSEALPQNLQKQSFHIYTTVFSLRYWLLMVLYYKCISSSLIGVNCFCDHARDVQMEIGAGSGVAVDAGVENGDTQ